MAPNVDDYRWLVSDAAVPLIERVAAELTGGKAAGVALVSNLRKDLPAQRVHLVVEQIELRERAREKFALSERMFFTRKGRKQATDEHVAAVKAARFPSDRAISDLCCGIGGDLLALARRCPAFGYDLDDVAVRWLKRTLAFGVTQRRIAAHGSATRSSVPF